MTFTEEYVQGQELLAKTLETAQKLSGRKKVPEFNMIVLALIAYRLCSENFVAFLENEEYQARKFKREIDGYNFSLSYATIEDSAIPRKYVDFIKRKKGYFILPSELFGMTTLRAKRNLRNFKVNGKKYSIDKVVLRFFKIVEKSRDKLFSEYFDDPRRFGKDYKEQSLRLANLLFFVDSMSYEIIGKMLELL